MLLDGPAPRQLAVLREIFASVEKRGFPPTIRELCKKLKISSTNACAEHLGYLVAKGLIERTPNVARGLRITSRGRDHLTGRAA